MRFGSCLRLPFICAWLFLRTVGLCSAYVVQSKSNVASKDRRRGDPRRSLSPYSSVEARYDDVGNSQQANHAAIREAISTSRTVCAGAAVSRHGEPELLQQIRRSSSSGIGLYRPIAELVWDKIANTGWMEHVAIPSELASNQAPARGMKGGDWVTRIETRALTAAVSQTPQCGSPRSGPLSYARMALIETIPLNFDNCDGVDEGPWTGEDSSASNCVHSLGVQVLNLVVFPPPTSRLPVWGADFVSLPGDRHLLLLDAQPMDARIRGGNVSSFDRYWDVWHEKSNVATLFPWGGDMPDPVKAYVSSNALWTRMGGTATGTQQTVSVDPIERRVQHLSRVVESHLDIYLRLACESYAHSEAADNSQREYICYRLGNDPARPMLKSLYGEEWTDRVLMQVLFPTLDI